MRILSLTIRLHAPWVHSFKGEADGGEESDCKASQ